MLPDQIAQARRDYLENQALVTSPTAIVQMLYQVAIDNLHAALDFLKCGDALARARVVTKAEEAVDELLLALDHSVGAQFTRTLADLYRYILGQIVIGHARQSEQAFLDALTILESLADTWSQVRAKLHAEAEASEMELAKEAEAATEPEANPEANANREARDSYSAYSSGSAQNSGVAVAPGRDWSA
jgi:flagellar biosynthetic protein FliS